MTKQDIHELVWNYLFDKAYDEDKLFEEIEYLLKSFDQWCGYTSQEIWEYWNDTKKRYEFGDEFIPFLINHITLDNKTYDVERYQNYTDTQKTIICF
jgi:hypothetical protein